MALKKMMWTGVAIAATLTIGAPSSVFAQAGAAPAAAPAQRGAGGAPPDAQGGGGRGRGRGPQYFTPAPGAKDLKSTLFNWAWYMGQLRSDQEYDVLMTLEYTGKGTMQLDGQPCNLSKYRMSIAVVEQMPLPPARPVMYMGDAI